MTTLRKAVLLMTPEERRSAIPVAFLLAVMSILEVAGMASVLPFLSILSNPGLIHSNDYFSGLFEFFNFSSSNAFLIAAAATSLTMLMISAAVRIYGTYFTTKFAQTKRHTISARLFESYLLQPYTFYLTKNTDELKKIILSEVDQVINRVFQPLANVVSQFFTLVIILIAIVLIDPWVALAAGFVIGLVYATVYTIIRKRLSRIGKEEIIANKKRFEVAGEAFKTIKETKYQGKEHYFLNAFKPSSAIMAENNVLLLTLGQVPKFAVEAVGLGGVLVVGLIVLLRESASLGSSTDQILPILGLYAFAGYRLLPAVQAIFHAISNIRFGVAAVENLFEAISSGSFYIEPKGEGISRLAFENSLILKDISYIYPESKDAGIRNINLEIEAKSSLGLVGETGAGKTTLVDIVLGLLHPSSGSMVVDGEEISKEKTAAWQETVGYVPQQIHLIDATIIENIAFGVPKEKIDKEKAIRCAKIAQLNSFVERELDEGYDARVGESGIRLSGGQRQRIGIARALYRDPGLIVFDEATSALDNSTESEVISSIDSFSKGRATILVAHRLSTIQNCDQIGVMKQGKLLDLGTYEELLSRCEYFQELVRQTRAPLS